MHRSDGVAVSLFQDERSARRAVQELVRFGFEARSIRVVPLNGEPKEGAVRSLAGVDAENRPSLAVLIHPEGRPQTALTILEGVGGHQVDADVQSIVGA